MTATRPSNDTPPATDTRPDNHPTSGQGPAGQDIDTDESTGGSALGQPKDGARSGGNDDPAPSR